MDDLSPITVLVGRNNTGKSAFLEAIALASSAEGGWTDALGTDILHTLLKKRGGTTQAPMMIKMDATKATVELKGEQIDGSLEVFASAKNVPENFMDVLASYMVNRASLYFERIIDYLATREHMKGSELERLMSREDIIKSLFTSLIKEGEAYLFYNDKLHESLDYALIIKEERLKSLDMRLEHELGVAPGRLLLLSTRLMREPLEEIIRSKPRTRSKMVFMLEASPDYLKKLQRDLLKSGELITLIESIKERISYFRDLREIDGDFFVYLKPFKKPIPLNSMGDGFRAKLVILSILLMTRGGVILMEEPEMRLHPGFIGTVTEQMVSAAFHKEAQFIVSTHSLEFLKYLLKANAEVIKVIRMYLIEKTGEVDYEVLDGDEALRRIEKLEEDLRGP